MNTVHVVGEYEEVTGILKEIDLDKCTLSFENTTVYLPVDPDKIAPLEQYLDQRIAVLRTDYREAPILVILEAE